MHPHESVILHAAVASCAWAFLSRLVDGRSADLLLLISVHVSVSSVTVKPPVVVAGLLLFQQQCCRVHVLTMPLRRA